MILFDMPKRLERLTNYIDFKVTPFVAINNVE